MNWMTAEEALAHLGTKAQTLYANVSRGRIRSKSDPKDPRRSLYNGQDVKKLAERKSGRRRADSVAAETIRWGDPILSSSLSTIVGGKLYYRGKDAVALAETETLETIASLLWDATVTWTDAMPGPAPHRSSLPLEAAFVSLAHAVATDIPSLGRGVNALQRDGARVVNILVGAITGEPAGPEEMPIHRRLARAWQRPEAEDVIRRALVLLADHELNASTFAARVAISTGSPLSAAVLAGLSTLTGPLHGSAAAAIAALADTARSGGTRQAVLDSLAQGRTIPAFDHPLYPDGDCRAAALLGHFEMTKTYAELKAVGEQVVGEKPNIDFALAAITDAFALPTDTPLTLFAVSRCVGWIAHALEQRATGTLIRPRANYVGPPIEV